MQIIYGIDATIWRYVQFCKAQACNPMRILETELLPTRIVCRRLLYFSPTSSVAMTLEVTVNPPQNAPIRNRMIKNIQKCWTKLLPNTNIITASQHGKYVFLRPYLNSKKYKSIKIYKYYVEI